MSYLFFIFFFFFSCDENFVSDIVNYDHCDLYSKYSEGCESIIDECNINDGLYSVHDNDENINWGESSGCCCVFP